MNHVLPATDPRQHSQPPLGPAGPPQPSRGGPPTGTAVVLGVMLLAAALGGFAVWFQWGQTRRCLGFFGPEVTRQIQSAASVELWFLEPGASGPVVVRRQDVSRAAGLVHLRRGLIEDVNYRWPDEDGRAPISRGPLPPAAWDVALAFFTDVVAEAPVASPSLLPAAVVAIDLDEPGSLTVVGRPGRVALGRLGPGLRRWVEATTKDGFSWEKSAY